ncbi:MAG: hypothetical protein K2X27_25735 [Candidatus Obscuribacterales bacterium]|nr:hypothetical protein [Candidatus Obscuribacterales bacterium]
MRNNKHQQTGVNEELALGLLKLEDAAHPEAGVVFSPLSLSVALGLALNGSRGQTREATVRALGFGPGRSLRGINESFGQLKDSLAEPTELDFDMANGLVCGSELQFKPNFQNKAAQYFDARIRLLDFNDPAAIVLMNSFVCQRTRGKVPAVVDELESTQQEQLILLSGVSFRGPWTYGFNRLLTQAEPFQRLDGSRSDCALMYREGQFDYRENMHFQALKLSYGTSRRFSMYVFLPRAEGEFGLKRMFDAIEQEGLSKCFSRFAAANGKLFLPRFKLSYGSVLNDSLRQLGLGELFDQSMHPDLASMTRKRSPQMVTLKQKTVVEVSEDGADDAPAEKSGVIGMLLREPSEFVFSANRPFCFFVRDEQNGTLTLAGIVKNPSLK